MRSKILKILLTAVIFSLFVVTPALAVSKTVGGVYCTAIKTIPSVTWGINWTGNIYSTAASPIGTIGWTYWTTREVCNGVYVHATTHPPRAAHYDNRETATYTEIFYSSCGGGTQQIQVVGTHDFAQGSEIWRPEFTISKTR